MEVAALDSRGLKVFVGDVHAGSTGALVEPGLDLQTSFGSGVADEAHGRLMALERSAVSILGDVGEQLGLDLVRLPGAGRMW